MVQALAGVIGPLLGIGGTAATTISTAVLYAGTTALSTLIQMANQPRQDVGTKLRAASGGAVAQSMQYAEKETAGSLIYAGTWGRAAKTPNTYYVRVFCLGDLPISGIKNPAWISDKKETIDFGTLNYTDVDTDYPGDGSGYSGSGQSMGWPVTSLDHDGNHYTWIKFLDGTQTAADPYLLAKFGGLEDRPWTADMIGRGRPLLIVTQRFTVKEPDTEISVAVVAQGVKDYDWRRDGTNGGSGAQRWGDQSTYSYNSGNPVRAIYNIMRGIYYGNTWLYGGQNWPARRFDADTWTAAANACDEDMPLKNGGTRKRYRFGAEISFSEEPLTVIERLLACCNGRLVESGGVYKIYVGGIGAPVLSITDDDIVITEALSGKLFPAREEIANTITGTYVEPGNGGQTKAYKKRSNADFVAADGGQELPKEMNFDYVRDNVQAQVLAQHGLKENRRFMTKSGGLPSLARKLEPCDVVNWNSARFGFVNKKFIVGDVTISETGIVVPILREADPTDQDWSVSDEDPYTLGVYGTVVPANQTIDIDVDARGVRNNSGTYKRPGIRVRWNIDADMVDCKAVRWQVRLLDIDEIMDRGRVEFDEGQVLIKDGILKNEAYQVRAKIIPYSDRDTDWCAWVTVVADNYGAIGDDDVDHSPPPDMPENPVWLPAHSNRPQVTSDASRDSGDGKIVVKATVAWAEHDNKRLDYQIRVAYEDKVRWINARSSPHEFTVRAGVELTIRTRPVSVFGVLGELSDETVYTPTKKIGWPTPPDDLQATGKWKKIVLEFPLCLDADFRRARIYRADEGQSFASASRIGFSTTGKYTDNLGNGVTKRYWVINEDTSGNWRDSDRYPSGAGVEATTLRIGEDDTDIQRPNAPTGLTLTPFIRVAESGENILKVKASWTASVALPIKGSYICFVDDGDSVEKYPTDSDDTSVSFRVRSGVPINVWVKSVKFNGLRSLTSSIVSITPSKKAVNADVALGLTVSTGFKENALRWTKSAQPDYKWTAIYRRTTSPIGAWSLIDTVKGTRFTDKNLTPGVYYDYKIKHVDTNDIEGAESSAYSSAGAAILAGDTDTSAPTVPAAPTLANRQYKNSDGTLHNKIKVTWPAPTSTVSIAYYEVQIDDGADVDCVKTQNRSHVIKHAVYGQTYTVSIAAISKFGISSGFGPTTSLSPLSKASYSGGTTGITSATAYEHAIHAFFNKPSDTDYTYAEFSASLANGIHVPMATAYDGACMIPTPDSAARYIAVRYRDKSGNPSSWIQYGSLVAAKAYSDLAANSADVAQIANSAVNYNKLADNAVANRMADATAGAVGSYAFLKNNSGSGIAANGTTSASNLAYSSTAAQDGTGSLSGTWRAMGGVANGQATNFLRIS